jgi:hypothetical protein
MAMSIFINPLTSAVVYSTLTRGHAALAYEDVGVGFADTATVVPVGSQDLWV